jgi:hypothetical protein
MGSRGPKPLYLSDAEAREWLGCVRSVIELARKNRRGVSVNMLSASQADNVGRRMLDEEGSRVGRKDDRWLVKAVGLPDDSIPVALAADAIRALSEDESTGREFYESLRSHEEWLSARWWPDALTRYLVKLGIDHRGLNTNDAWSAISGAQDDVENLLTSGLLSERTRGPIKRALIKDHLARQRGR